MLRESSDFSEESVKKSWGKESANESGSKFIPSFENSKEFVNVFVRIGFGSAIKLVSFDKSQVVTFNSKFIRGFRNKDYEIGSWYDNIVSSSHGFIIHWIEIFKNHEKVTKVVDVENWRIDNSRVLRWVIYLIERNSPVSSTKSSIQSLGFLTSLIFIFFVGIFASSWMGATIFWVGEWFIKRMPFVKHIYSASKQISAAISPELKSFLLARDQNTTAFKEVAIIRHPRLGEYIFGFITSSVVL
ncbi:COV 2-like protein [Tanacetum coccineum]